MPTCTAISNTQTVELSALTLTSGFCHSTLQLTHEEFVNRTTGQLAGNMAAFMAGDETPTEQDKLWFKQDGTGGAHCVPVDGGWHWYNGNTAEWEPVKENVTTSPIGTIVMYAAAAAPTGWLLCDGEVADAGTYPALNTLLGTLYGTQGQTPDLRSRMPVGLGDAGEDYTDRSLNDTGGAETHVLAVGELPEHTHDTSFILSAGYSGSGTQFEGAPGSEMGAVTRTTDVGTGGGGAHENMPPFITLNFIIRAVV